MSREIDVKALVSHIVRGDGADKCRICMGDTSEGQVYLGDTVMMDGEKPVTLSELLEVITGVQVMEDDDLPKGLCSVCSGSAVDAAHFSMLCRLSNTHWNTKVQLLENLPLSDTLEKYNKAIFAIVNNDQMTVLDDFIYDNNVESKKQLGMKELAAPIKNRTKKLRHRPHSLLCHCHSCGRKFHNAVQLSQHLKDSIDLTRACHVCAKIMKRDRLIKHLCQEHHIEPFDCKLCPALLYSYNSLAKHLITAHAKGACTCGDCGRSFQSEYAFRAHQSVHYSQSCPGCSKLFRNQSCYVYHVKRCCDLNKDREDTHYTKSKVTVEVRNELSKKKIRVGMRGSTQKECICDYCGKKFAGKKFVSTHIQTVHLKNTHRPCPYCGKFLASVHMTEHIKGHETVTSFKCSHCNLVLKTKLGYIQHLRLHTGEKPYACKFCGETFSASSRRSDHVRKVHSLVSFKYACEMCPAKFQMPYRLKKHMAAVHSEKAELSVLYECSECLERFGSLRGLIHHKRKHQQDVVLKPRKKFCHVKLDANI